MLPLPLPALAQHIRLVGVAGMVGAQSSVFPCIAPSISNVFPVVISESVRAMTA